MFNDAIKKIMSKQITNNILMIKPISFRYNDQTSKDNYYQNRIAEFSDDKIQKKALLEFDFFVKKLLAAGINIIVVEDTNDFDTPDSLFPNNWVSFHQSGDVVIYPMCAVNRRNERKIDIFTVLEKKFRINKINDFTEFENNKQYLEGTGSMVLDRENKICYAALSMRTVKSLVVNFCNQFNYTPVLFHAMQNVNNKRVPIYHTNVMMCIGDKFAIICLSSIDDKLERENVVKSIELTNKEIIEINEFQKHRFAGNMLQVSGFQDYLVMSESAYNSLTDKQIKKIEKYCSIIYAPLNTIEKCGGGSARCMMAEIFLPIKC